MKRIINDTLYIINKKTAVIRRLFLRNLDRRRRPGFLSASANLYSDRSPPLSARRPAISCNVRAYGGTFRTFFPFPRSSDMRGRPGTLFAHPGLYSGRTLLL